ncbi:MAG: tetratricopeptide repeat protein [Bacteroidaceae bacterium]|nr:tetratricopeptide repeat protein [Bacteroidaceae bacterium]
MRDSVYDKAQVEYQKAIEQDNTNPISHYNLGNALLYQNKAEDAMKEYETAARLEKDKLRLAQIYHNMGVILQAAKQFDKAVACYQNSLRNDPTCNETRYNYALSLFQLKKNQQNQDNQEQQQDDKGQNEKEEKQQQQQQEQEKKDEQQPQPQQDQMSRENAEQMLNAAMQDEKATQEKIQKAQQQRQQKQLQKQW